MRLASSLFVCILTAGLASGCSGDVGQAGSVGTAGTSLSVVPATATTSRGGEVDFTASFSGDPSLQTAGFSWSVEESNGGTVDASGRYTAPETSGTFHVVVTS